MSWTKFFDCIFVINLRKRRDRLGSVRVEFESHNFEYYIFYATENINGQQGVYDSLISLFKDCLRWGFKNVLVFEDDVKMLADPIEFERVMDLAVIELPTSWEMLYLGANLPSPDSVAEYSAHLLVAKRALALHAVAYSRECMEMIVALPKMLPVDLQIANFIHPRGRTFITYPILCSQQEGFSDIEKRQTNYKIFIEDRYEKVVQHLNLRNER